MAFGKCCICLQNVSNSDWFPVSSHAWDEYHIAEIINKHLWPMPEKSIHIKSGLCFECWRQLSDFNSFYNRVHPSNFAQSDEKEECISLSNESNDRSCLNENSKNAFSEDFMYRNIYEPKTDEFLNGRHNPIEELSLASSMSCDSQQYKKDYDNINDKVGFNAQSSEMEILPNNNLPKSISEEFEENPNVNVSFEGPLIKAYYDEEPISVPITPRAIKETQPSYSQKTAILRQLKQSSIERPETTLKCVQKETIDGKRKSVKLLFHIPRFNNNQNQLDAPSCDVNGEKENPFGQISLSTNTGEQQICVPSAPTVHHKKRKHKKKGIKKTLPSHHYAELPMENAAVIFKMGANEISNNRNKEIESTSKCFQKESIGTEPELVKQLLDIKQLNNNQNQLNVFSEEINGERGNPFGLISMSTNTGEQQICVPSAPRVHQKKKKHKKKRIKKTSPSHYYAELPMENAAIIVETGTNEISNIENDIAHKKSIPVVEDKKNEKMEEKQINKLKRENKIKADEEIKNGKEMKLDETALIGLKNVDQPKLSNEDTFMNNKAQQLDVNNILDKENIPQNAENSNNVMDNKTVGEFLDKKMNSTVMSNNEDDNFNNPELHQLKQIENDKFTVTTFKIQCPICEPSYVFKDFAELRGHFQSEHGETPAYFTCCDRKFYKLDDLCEHACKYLSQEEWKQCDKFVCKICNKKFNLKKSFENHSFVHVPMNERAFPCKECPQRFGTQNLLNNHIRNVHEKKYIKICEYCGESLLRKDVFNRHMQTHQGNLSSKLKCGNCGLLLTDSRGLRRHQLLHHPKNGKQEHPCDICTHISPNAQALKRHIHYKHKMKSNHECRICGKMFKRSQSLIEHMSTHTNKTLYGCPYCSKTSNSSSNMYAHRKHAHYKEWIEEQRKKYNQENNALETTSTFGADTTTLAERAESQP